MNTNVNPLAQAIAAALLHEKAQRRMAVEDAADRPKTVAAQLQAESQPTDEAALPAAE